LIPSTLNCSKFKNLPKDLAAACLALPNGARRAKMWQALR